MRIDVSFSYVEHFSNNGDVYIVIDVLRASSTIVVLLERGIEEIRVLPSLPSDEEKEKLRKDYILIGEYENKDIPGFDFPNSPSLLSNCALKKKRVALFTTNGTLAVNVCPQGGKTVVGSGFKGKVSLEDVLCGGAVVERLVDRVPTVDFDDGARIAFDFWRLMNKE